MTETILIAGIVAGLLFVTGFYKSAVGGFFAVCAGIMAYRGVVLHENVVWTDALLCLFLLSICWYYATIFCKTTKAK